MSSDGYITCQYLHVTGNMHGNIVS